MGKNMHKKLKHPHYGTTNLHKRAKTWVWVVTDVHNFALRAPCALTLPLASKEALTTVPDQGCRRYRTSVALCKCAPSHKGGLCPSTYNIQPLHVRFCERQA